MCLKSLLKKLFKKRVKSLEKVLYLESDSQNSDSFSERICDDLSEVILQYLSLEDKLRLQCVSKQFQRTVFKRHYEFTFRGGNDLLDKTKIDIRLTEDDCIDLKPFESLLKKC